MNFHIHFWKTVKNESGIKYQECRCKDRRITNSTGIAYSDGRIISFPFKGFQPFDYVWLEDNLLEDECKFCKDGACYINDMTDRIKCTGKGHDLEHCGDYQAYKAEEEGGNG